MSSVALAPSPARTASIPAASPMRDFYIDVARGHIEAARETLRDPDPELRERHRHTAKQPHSHHHSVNASAQQQQQQQQLLYYMSFSGNESEALGIYLHRHPAVLSELRRRTENAASPSRSRRREARPAAAGAPAPAAVSAVHLTHEHPSNLQQICSEGDDGALQQLRPRPFVAPRRLAPTPTPFESRCALQHLPHVYPRVLAVARLEHDRYFRERAAAHQVEEDEGDDDEESHSFDDEYADENDVRPFRDTRRGVPAALRKHEGPVLSRRQRQIARVYSAPPPPLVSRRAAARGPGAMTPAPRPTMIHDTIQVPDAAHSRTAFQRAVSKARLAARLGSGVAVAATAAQTAPNSARAFQRAAKRVAVATRLARSRSADDATVEHAEAEAEAEGDAEQRKRVSFLDATRRLTMVARLQRAAADRRRRDEAHAEALRAAEAAELLQQQEQQQRQREAIAARQKATVKRYFGGVAGVAALRAKLMHSKFDAQRAISARQAAELERLRQLEEEELAVRARGFRPLPRVNDFALGQFSAPNSVNNSGSGAQMLQVIPPGDDFRPVQSARMERHQQRCLRDDFEVISPVSPRVQERIVTALRPLADASFDLAFAPRLAGKNGEDGDNSSRSSSSGYRLEDGGASAVPLPSGMRPMPRPPKFHWRREQQQQQPQEHKSAAAVSPPTPSAELSDD